MKRKIILLYSIAVLGISNVACSNNDDGDGIAPQKKYPLTTFAVKVGNSYYHGKIDQTTHKVEIGAIENANTITGVDYTLMSDGATISPNPSVFIGEWEKEQKVTVTTEDKATTTYTIVLTKFDDSNKDIIFRDEFNTDGIPDPSKWVLCEKGTSDWCDEMSESYDQAYVKNGNLVLKAEKVNGVYKAGGIDSHDKFAFTFGRVEVRARITQHPDGAFPAIWMMPQKTPYPSWPNGGEIDIMEHIKQEANIHQTVHTNYTYVLNIKDPANSKPTVCNYGDYNVYGFEWNENELIFSVNGQTTFTYPNLRLADEGDKKQWPFTKDSSFYLILNMGLGGKSDSWAGLIDDNNLPAIMEIDWVRVFKLSK